MSASRSCGPARPRPQALGSVVEHCGTITGPGRAFAGVRLGNSWRGRGALRKIQSGSRV